LQARQAAAGDAAIAWRFLERWISEIVADFWAIARVGIASTTGLIAVVSLPRAFVFRVSLDDPHPFPWIRVKLSCAIGSALFPDPQWEDLSQLWESFYPTTNLDDERRDLIGTLTRTLPEFVSLLRSHRPPKLGGQSIPEALATEDRTPGRLRRMWRDWRAQPALMRRARPSLVFAVIGQARADGAISPEHESRMLGRLLERWAFLDATGSLPALEPSPAEPGVAGSRNQPYSPHYHG
ncbi:MAG: hypothetical protein AB7J34_24640, partial [Limisphaerales bacterium]